MSTSHRRARHVAAPLLIAIAALIGASCAPEPPPYTGIIFNVPSIGYVGKQITPTATSTSGLPVTLSLDASSTACTFEGGVLAFTSAGNCVVNADQPGNGTIPADPRVQRTIRVYECPTLRSGRWTGPLDVSADVVASGSTFSGTVDLTSFGYGVQLFAGIVSCEVVSMTFNGTPLRGVLSPDGSTLSGSYQGIDIVLVAPPA